MVIDAGQVAARGTPDALKRRHGRHTLDVRLADPTRLREAAARVAQIVQTDPILNHQNGHLSAAVTDGQPMPAIVRSLDEANIEVSELALRLPSLDDVFLALTGHRPTTDQPSAPTGREGRAS